MKDFKEYYEGQERKAATLDAAPPSYRDDIVKDNYNDFNDKFYGNNDIMASHAMHGTHVSGIIAAARNNGVGIDGVADNVRIMTIRAVPDGDEHDKDIALGIRYAVDNGAKVINMSFGKSFSPEKKWVDDAVKYALSKDVLLVHAAGNDGKNIDESENYPNPEFIGTSIVASNFITVGASGDISTGGLAADFSNYGKNKVDVFAPGVKIYSSVPGGNTYAYQQGTSMASPVVAGIAALLRSYYPELTAVQIKYCIENGVAKIEGNVQKPGEEEEISFTLLSKTGGIVNALGAVNVAETLNPGVHNRHPIQSDPKIKLPNELPGNNNNSFTGNGTGFFINENGYIVTNYHVVKGASLIHAEYIVNNIKRIHSAQVILQDENNDLAILKINDPKFQPTPPIPFVFSSKSMDAGIEVFTIGYPFADVMGFAPKFSSGYISSLSGINDDSRFYQISVPLQPGNSGGPLFDNKGNLVGITSGALNKELFNSENVNYAIKTILLKELINKLPNKINLPNDISIYNLTNENRIKRIQQFVPIIRVR
jgi:S1-C subfamily serine protease